MYYEIEEVMRARSFGKLKRWNRVPHGLAQNWMVAYPVGDLLG